MRRCSQENCGAGAMWSIPLMCCKDLLEMFFARQFGRGSVDSCDQGCASGCWRVCLAPVSAELAVEGLMRFGLPSGPVACRT